MLDRIAGDDTALGGEPLAGLAAEDGQLAAFIHDGFWQPMDTLRDKTQLEALWASGIAALEDLVERAEPRPAASGRAAASC